MPSCFTLSFLILAVSVVGAWSVDPCSLAFSVLSGTAIVICDDGTASIATYCHVEKQALKDPNLRAQLMKSSPVGCR